MDDLAATAVVTGAAGAALVASPYLAALTLSVPDHANATWGRPCTSSRAQRALAAAVAVVFAALGGAASGWTAARPANLVLALAGVVLAIVDVEHHRLPDRMIFCAAVAAASVFLLVAALEDRWAALGRAATAAALALVLLSRRR